MKTYKLIQYFSDRHNYTFEDVTLNIQNYTVDFSNEDERSVNVHYRIYSNDAIQDNKEFLVTNSFHFIFDVRTNDNEEVSYVNVEEEINNRFEIVLQD